MSETRPHFNNERISHLYRWGPTTPDELLGYFLLEDGTLLRIRAKDLDLPRRRIPAQVQEFFDFVDLSNRTAGLAMGLPEAAEIRGEGPLLPLRDYQAGESRVPPERAAKSTHPLANRYRPSPTNHVSTNNPSEA